MFKLITNNIKIKIILLLLITTTLIATLFSVYQYTQQRDSLEEKLEIIADRKIQRLSQNLVIPLWEIDDNWINKIVDTEMQDRELYAILIKGEGGLSFGKQRNEEWKTIETVNQIEGAFVKRSSAILYNSDEIGDVTIYISNKFIEKEIKSDAINHFYSTILLVFFLIISLYILLNHFIFHPLKSILHTVEAITHGDYTRKIELNQSDEIGKLARGFNHMFNSVQEKEDMMIAQSRHAAMGEMISMIAHQWRQPITVISMIANNLLADIEFDELETKEVGRSAQKVLKQTQHLSKTIDDFKNFFRPNKKVEKALVNDILEETFLIIGKSLENNDISVKKIYNATTQVDIFSRELLQVFINVLKNAKEALLENKIVDPLITVTTSETSDAINISICDNGIGIDPKILNKVFDPYFSTKNEKVGTGLGLYMSKTIVEKHIHGTIKAINNESGVCFVISIPKRENQKSDGEKNE